MRNSALKDISDETLGRQEIWHRGGKGWQKAKRLGHFWMFERVLDRIIPLESSAEPVPLKDFSLLCR